MTGIDIRRRIPAPFRRLMKTLVIYLLFVLTSILALLPVLWGISASFTPLSKVFKYTIPFSWRALVPLSFTLEAYRGIFAGGFGRAIINTLIISVTVMLIGGLVSAMAGFSFARFKFKGRAILFVFVMFTFMVPVEVMIIPLYILVGRIGWLNSWQGLIVPSLANSLVIFLFRQFFAEIPADIIDASRIDSASWLRIFSEIILPMSKPVLVSAGLLLFLQQWNSFFWPLVVAPKETLRVVQVAISFTLTEHGMMWNQLMAGSMLAAVIPIVILLPFQRYYVSGLVGSGLKG